MLFYNARSCYPGPGGLVVSVTDSGGGVTGSNPHTHTHTSLLLWRYQILL